LIGWTWEFGGAAAAALAPLVAVPLAAITFYLRSLHEHQVVRHAELVRRFELLESVTSAIRNSTAAFERDYTTKEEWLRECMFARGRGEHLAEIVARLQARVEAPQCPAAQGGSGDGTDRRDVR